jgi:hypothetical protein
MKLPVALVVACTTLPCLSAEYVVTSRTNGVLTGYPLQPPAGSFVEVVQTSAETSVWPLRVDFSDGRTTSDFDARNLHAGFKLVGVSSITAITTANHTIVWKLTPAAEFAKNGATYRTLLEPRAGQPNDVYTVPSNSNVTVIQFKGAPGDSPSLSLTSSVPGLSVAQTDVPVPSPSYPFLTAIKSQGGTVLLEVTGANSPSSLTVSVQRSDNLQTWETLHSFQIAPTMKKEFFRAVMIDPAR